jgi:hypothetical protein
LTTPSVLRLIRTDEVTLTAHDIPHRWDRYDTPLNRIVVQVLGMASLLLIPLGLLALVVWFKLHP